MKKIIYSYADNRRYYSNAQRQWLSMKAFWDGDYICYTPQTSGFPTHTELHCGFKLYGMLKLMDEYHSILCIDSSVWAISSIEPIFEQLERDGYVFFDNKPFKVGQWISDSALKILGKTRRERLEMDSISGGIWGLDLRQDIAKRYLNRLNEVKQALQCPTKGETGDNRIRDNKNNDASTSALCLGHRGQSVMSVIAYELGMTKNWLKMDTHGEDGTALYWNSQQLSCPNKETIFLVNGG